MSSDSENNILVKVDAEKGTFSLKKDDFIGLTAKNVSSDKIYYSTCNSGMIEELNGSKVKRFVVFVNPCECICTFAIEPGYQDEIHINSYLIRDHDELQFSSSVKYRVTPNFYFDENLERRISTKSVQVSPITILIE